MYVLLLEDDELDAAFIEKAVRRVCPDAIVDRVQTAEAGLDLMAHKAEDGYDFILVDQHLPGQFGSNFIRQVQALGLRGNAVTVMLTGDVSEQARSEALASDFDTFIAKPIQVARLTDVLNRRGLYWEREDIPRDLELYKELRKQA